MKKILVIGVIILFALLFSLMGCGTGGAETPNVSDTTDTSENDVYSTLIELLRGEIEALKNEQIESKEEYESKIAELEKQIAELEGGSEEKPNDTTDKPDDPEEPSPFTYKIENGSAVITAYSGNYSVLVIPDTLDGYTVTSIADSVFSGNTSLTSVSLPKELKTLGWFAFSGCTSLKSATLPKSLSEIGYDAFAHCTKLTIYCEKDSYAEKFAESYGISCVAN